MNLLLITSILIIGLLLWAIWGFFKYKLRERGDKNEIYSYIREGSSLQTAIQKTFSNLNEFSDLGLSDSTVKSVSEGIAKLQKTGMSINNAIEIYSTFVYRYIFNDGRDKKPKKLSEQKIIYALSSLEFQERNGYFVIKPDSGEDFNKKYPI